MIVSPSTKKLSASPWSRLTELRWCDWRDLLVALVLLPLIDVSLRLRGYQRTRTLCMRFAPTIDARPTAIATSTASIDQAQRTARMVSIAGRRSLWPTSCLRQALVLWLLLARRGVSTQIRIGVEGGASSEFSAHAWVEGLGQVLIGGEHVRERYVVLL